MEWKSPYWRGWTADSTSGKSLHLAGWLCTRINFSPARTPFEDSSVSPHGMSKKGCSSCELYVNDNMSWCFFLHSYVYVAYLLTVIIYFISFGYGVVLDHSCSCCACAAWITHDGEASIPIELHEVSEEFRFTIPNFPVLPVCLRSIKFAVIGQDDKEVLLDRFIRDDSLFAYLCMKECINQRTGVTGYSERGFAKHCLLEHSRECYYIKRFSHKPIALVTSTDVFHCGWMCIRHAHST